MIGIHSISTCYNYGALLQCWSLQQAIIENSDEGVVHIEIKSERKLKNIIKFFIKDIFNKKKSHILKREESANNFKLYLLPTIEYNTINEVNTSKIRTIIIGSDEVLNYSEHTTSLMRGILPKDLAISINGYALSLGNESRIDTCVTNGFNAYGYKKVGVRDSASKKLFKLFNRSSIINLDPVLLPSKESFDKLKENLIFEKNFESIFEKKYILVYSDMLSVKLCPYLEELYPLNNFLILGNLENSLEKNKLNMENKFNFLDSNFPIHRIPELFENSQGVITGFFHGIVLSLRYEKPFKFLRNKTKEFKVFDLMETLNHKYVVENGEPRIDSIEEWKFIYNTLTNEINKKRDSSLEYLNSIIQDR